MSPCNSRFIVTATITCVCCLITLSLLLTADAVVVVEAAADLVSCGDVTALLTVTSKSPSNGMMIQTTATTTSTTTAAPTTTTGATMEPVTTTAPGTTSSAAPTTNTSDVTVEPSTTAAAGARSSEIEATETKQQQPSLESSSSLSFSAMLQGVFSFMKDQPPPAGEMEADVESSGVGADASTPNVAAAGTTTAATKTTRSTTRHRVPLLPLLLNTLPLSAAVVQRDLISRVKTYRFGPQPSMLGGEAHTTSFKFFTTLAAAVKSDVAASWTPSAGTISPWFSLDTDFPIIAKNKNAKPWIIDMDRVRNTLETLPWNIDTNDITLAYGAGAATLDTLKAKLLHGFYVVVVFQTSLHFQATCSTYSIQRRDVPWPIEQARSMLSLVVGIDNKFVYLVDSCSSDFIKVKRNEFVQRWHACEETLGCITGRAIYFASTAGNSDRVLGNNPDDLGELKNAMEDK